MNRELQAMMSQSHHVQSGSEVERKTSRYSQHSKHQRSSVHRRISNRDEESSSLSSESSNGNQLVVKNKKYFRSHEKRLNKMKKQQKKTDAKGSKHKSPTHRNHPFSPSAKKDSPQSQVIKVPGQDMEKISPKHNESFEKYTHHLHELLKEKGGGFKEAISGGNPSENTDSPSKASGDHSDLTQVRNMKRNHSVCGQHPSNGFPFPRHKGLQQIEEEKNNGEENDSQGLIQEKRQEKLEIQKVINMMKAPQRLSIQVARSENFGDQDSDTIEEFDQDFIQQHPRLSKQLDFYRKKQSGSVTEEPSLSGRGSRSQLPNICQTQYYVNPTNNCPVNEVKELKEYNQLVGYKSNALNENRKGNIIPADFEGLPQANSQLRNDRNYIYMPQQKQFVEVLSSRSDVKKQQALQRSLHQQKQTQDKIQLVIDKIRLETENISQKKYITQQKIDLEMSRESDLHKKQQEEKKRKEAKHQEKKELRRQQEIKQLKQEITEKTYMKFLKDQVEGLREELRQEIKAEIYNQMPSESSDSLSKSHTDETENLRKDIKNRFSMNSSSHQDITLLTRKKEQLLPASSNISNFRNKSDRALFNRRGKFQAKQISTHIKNRSNQGEEKSQQSEDDGDRKYSPGPPKVGRRPLSITNIGPDKLNRRHSMHVGNSNIFFKMQQDKSQPPLASQGALSVHNDERSQIVDDIYKILEESRFKKQYEQHLHLNKMTEDSFEEARALQAKLKQIHIDLDHNAILHLHKKEVDAINILVKQYKDYENNSYSCSSKTLQSDTISSESSSSHSEEAKEIQKPSVSSSAGGPAASAVQQLQQALPAQSLQQFNKAIEEITMQQLLKLAQQVKQISNKSRENSTESDCGSKKELKSIGHKSQRSFRSFHSMASMKSIRSLQSNQKSMKHLHDLAVSEDMGCESIASMQRREILANLEEDYSIYLQKFQGMFIIRCQMMNQEFQQIKDKVDFDRLMVEFPNFSRLQNELKQDDIYYGYQTIVIDIENILVTHIEIRTKQELDLLQKQDNFKEYFIQIRKSPSKRKQKNKDEQTPQCCQFYNTDQCVCNLLVYQVRPYTYEFLRAINPFFELVVFSKMHHKVLEHIIDHIESVLNKPIRDNHRILRVQKMQEIKIYFQFIIHQRQYVYIKESDKWLENLMVLTKNRYRENLIFISSDPYRIVASVQRGICTIPIIQFQNFVKDDFQLNLVEHYILKIRHLQGMRERIRQDFLFLIDNFNASEKQTGRGAKPIEDNVGSSFSNKRKQFRPIFEFPKWSSFKNDTIGPVSERLCIDDKEDKDELGSEFSLAAKSPQGQSGPLPYLAEEHKQPSMEFRPIVALEKASSSKRITTNQQIQQLFNKSLGHQSGASLEGSQEIDNKILYVDFPEQQTKTEQNKQQNSLFENSMAASVDQNNDDHSFDPISPAAKVQPSSFANQQTIIEDVNQEIEAEDKKTFQANKFVHKQKSFGDLVNSHSNKISIRNKPPEQQTHQQLQHQQQQKLANWTSQELEQIDEVQELDHRKHKKQKKFSHMKFGTQKNLLQNPNLQFHQDILESQIPETMVQGCQKFDIELTKDNIASPSDTQSNHGQEQIDQHAAFSPAAAPVRQKRHNEKRETVPVPPTLILSQNSLVQSESSATSLSFQIPQTGLDRPGNVPSEMFNHVQSPTNNINPAPQSNKDPEEVTNQSLRTGTFGEECANVLKQQAAAQQRASNVNSQISISDLVHVSPRLSHVQTPKNESFRFKEEIKSAKSIAEESKQPQQTEEHTDHPTSDRSLSSKSLSGTEINHHQGVHHVVEETMVADAMSFKKDSITLTE